jgi:hypothetical protein
MAIRVVLSTASARIATRSPGSDEWDSGFL